MMHTVTFIVGRACEKESDIFRVNLAKHHSSPENMMLARMQPMTGHTTSKIISLADITIMNGWDGWMDWDFVRKYNLVVTTLVCDVVGMGIV